MTLEIQKRAAGRSKRRTISTSGICWGAIVTITIMGVFLAVPPWTASFAECQIIGVLLPAETRSIGYAPVWRPPELIGYTSLPLRENVSSALYARAKSKQEREDRYREIQQERAGPSPMSDINSRSKSQTPSQDILSTNRAYADEWDRMRAAIDSGLVADEEQWWLVEQSPVASALKNRCAGQVSVELPRLLIQCTLSVLVGLAVMITSRWWGTLAAAGESPV